jgi:hypothetical protein
MLSSVIGSSTALFETKTSQSQMTGNCSISFIKFLCRITPGATVSTFLNILNWMVWLARGRSARGNGTTVHIASHPHRWNFNGPLETRTCGATSDCDGVSCSRLGSVGVFCMWWKEKCLLCAWSITYESRKHFLKEVSFTILVQNNRG